MKRETEKRKIEDLKRHPLQSKYFTPPTKAEIEAMADSLEKDGLQHPIHILPDGTIIAGHTRVTGAERIGWKEIECIVRRDLLEQGETAIERFFLDDNKNRRQLGKLGMARIAARLMELEVGERRRRKGEGATRDFLGKQFGLSGRTLDRYMKMIHAPLPVQDAWDQKKLSDADVRRVLASPERVQRKIAERITNGELPKAVVNKLAVTLAAPKKRLLRAMQSIPRSVQRVYDLLGPDLGSDSLYFERDHLPSFRQALEQLGGLIAKLERDSQHNPLESVIAEIKKKL